ncbi:MAG: hypothetical protein WBV48_10295, partial [Candidatus Acidiferrales bacterium]
RECPANSLELKFHSNDAAETTSLKKRHLPLACELRIPGWERKSAWNQPGLAATENTDTACAQNIEREEKSDKRQAAISSATDCMSFAFFERRLVVHGRPSCRYGEFAVG